MNSIITAMLIIIFAYSVATIIVIGLLRDSYLWTCYGDEKHPKAFWAWVKNGCKNHD